MRLTDGHDARQLNELAQPVADLTVRRIARSLGVPVSTLIEPNGGDATADMTSATLAELHALVTAFRKLEHPAARRRCIAQAEAELLRQTRQATAQS